MRTIRSRRAVSPVIATVILVAVAITVAVAVAYWMGGIAGQYTKFEKIEIQSGVCIKLSDGGTLGDLEYWKISMKLKNSGTATATLVGVFINDVEVEESAGVSGYGFAYTDVSGTNAITDMSDTETVLSGDTLSINIFISCGYKALTSGTTVNIKIHSAGGMDYIKLVELV